MALVQTIPQQTATITLLQPRPASSSASPLPSQSHQIMARNQQTPRSTYRGLSSQPVAPYAFTSTPSLNTVASKSHPSPPATDSNNVPMHQRPTKHAYPGVIPPRGGQYFTPSASNQNQNQNQSPCLHRSQDDSALLSRPRLAARPRPLSTVDLALPPLLSPPLPASNAPSKPSPDRYRRGQRQQQNSYQRSPSPVIPSPDSQPSSSPPSSRDGTAVNSTPPSVFPSPRVYSPPTHNRGASADDARLKKQEAMTPELAKRYRRRSLGSLDTAGLSGLGASQFSPSPHANAMLSTPEIPLDPPTARPSSSASSDSRTSADAKTDAARRPINPSPLSKPLDLNHEDTSARPQTPGTLPGNPSPAAKRLIELAKKGRGKSSKSRLRRALSFSSVAELRAASSGEKLKDAPDEQLDENLDPEQAAIVQRQQASGLGENIYSGQGNVFAGSTDNLSISSTASSASIMLRKMGNGVKRSTRSLVGLFRPKSVQNLRAEAAPMAPMIPQVSMVTVEAQREQIADPVPQPSPETNGRAEHVLEDRPSSGSDGSSVETYTPRKSIIGGDKERAEVLAAVRRGILKRTGSNSPVVQPIDHAIADRSPPCSSAGNSPRIGHRRTDSVTIEGDDYVLPAGRFNSSHASSAPSTPPARNISFSPRIQFHDTWPSGEYDRRGDVATCNRLTPLLAQQIKEELNTFKMEMEVHESSKIYTHFF